MNADEILRMFCATEHEKREWMRNPILIDEFLYATNGHIAVRVPDAPGVVAHSFLEITVESRTLLRTMFLVDIPGPGVPIPDLTAPIPCSECGGTGHQERRECPECGGSAPLGCQKCQGDGFIVSPAPTGEACEYCEGYGENPFIPVAVAESHFDAHYLRLLQKLPNAMLHPDGMNAAACVFDGGMALIMPMAV
jgi:hypothetical protein